MQNQRWQRGKNQIDQWWKIGENKVWPVGKLKAKDDKNRMLWVHE